MKSVYKNLNRMNAITFYLQRGLSTDTLKYEKLYIIVLSDQAGIIFRSRKYFIEGLILDLINIVQMMMLQFLMRLAFVMYRSLHELTTQLRPLMTRLSADYRVVDAAYKTEVVSKEDRLQDMLYQWRAVPEDRNYRYLFESQSIMIVDWMGLPFHYIPKDKAVAESQLLAKCIDTEMFVMPDLCNFIVDFRKYRRGRIFTMFAVF